MQSTQVILRLPVGQALTGEGTFLVMGVATDVVGLPVVVGCTTT